MPMRCDDYKVSLAPEVDIEGERKALRDRVMSLDAQNAESMRQRDQAVAELKQALASEKHALASEKQMSEHLKEQIMRANHFEAENTRMKRVLEMIMVKSNQIAIVEEARVALGLPLTRPDGANS